MTVTKTLDELAEVARGRVSGDGSVVIKDAAPVEEAGVGHITFIANPKYLKFLSETGASAVIVSKDLADKAQARAKNLLVAADPYLAFARVLGVLRPSTMPGPGVHERAIVSEGVTLGDKVSIGAGAVIEEGARLGDRVIIYPGVYVGERTTVGEDSVLHANVSIREDVTIGCRVVVHLGSAIGGDGFGYAKDGLVNVKVPQTGTVIIEDDVEIGSSSTVDRATIGATVIGEGTKIDNLVQIAHNVRIGRNCIIVAQAGLAGSCSIGDDVTVAGQSAITGHIHVESGSTIGAKSAVTHTIKKAGVYTGFPATDHGKWLRTQAVLAKLPELRKRIEELEKKIKELEAGA